jgi:hypothetical protein
MTRKRCTCGVLAVVRRGIDHRLVVAITEQLEAKNISAVGLTTRLMASGYENAPTRVLVEATLAAVLALAGGSEEPPTDITPMV